MEKEEEEEELNGTSIACKDGRWSYLRQRKRRHAQAMEDEKAKKSQKVVAEQEASGDDEDDETDDDEATQRSTHKVNWKSTDGQILKECFYAAAVDLYKQGLQYSNSTVQEALKNAIAYFNEKKLGQPFPSKPSFIQEVASTTAHQTWLSKRVLGQPRTIIEPSTPVDYKSVPSRKEWENYYTSLLIQWTTKPVSVKKTPERSGRVGLTLENSPALTANIQSLTATSNQLADSISGLSKAITQSTMGLANGMIFGNPRFSIEEAMERSRLLKTSMEN